MRVEFNQGVSDEVIKWLWDNVGEGNVIHSVIEPTNRRRDPKEDDGWFYKRERQYPQPNDLFDPREKFPKYVPTITVKDPKLATWFVLRWTS